MSVPQKLSEQTVRSERRSRHSPKPRAWLKDWDFWRFVLAALGLLWEIVKTEYLK